MACSTAIADVTDGNALRLAADGLVAELGMPSIWVNCAGNGVYGRFVVVPEAEFDRVTAVTYGGTVNGCRVALNLMRQTGDGTIVNVCSATAFHGLPLMTSYAGAKAAVRGFAQALQAELTMERSTIRVSTVFPPAVNTPFFSHAPSHMGWPARPAPPVYQPEIVCEAIYLAAMTGQAELLVSGTVVAFSLIQRAFPRLIAYLMPRLGFDGQLTRDPEAARVQQQTLFEPSTDASPVRGPFGREAREFSSQVWLLRCRHTVAGGMATALAALKLMRRQASLSLTRPVQRGRD